MSEDTSEDTNDMTKKEAAAALGVAERTLERWTAQSKIGVRYERGKKGDAAIYDRGEVERFKAALDRPTHRPAVHRMEPRMDAPTSGDTSDTGIYHPMSPLPDAAQLDALARLLGALGITTTPDGQPRPLAALQRPETASERPVVPVEARLLLRVEDAAALLGVGRGAIEAAIRDGTLPAHRGAWRGRRIRREDLEAFVAALGTEATTTSKKEKQQGQ